MSHFYVTNVALLHDTCQRQEVWMPVLMEMSLAMGQQKAVPHQYWDLQKIQVLGWANQAVRHCQALSDHDNLFVGTSALDIVLWCMVLYGDVLQWMFCKALRSVRIGLGQLYNVNPGSINMTTPLTKLIQVDRWLSNYFCSINFDLGGFFWELYCLRINLSWGYPN